VGSLDSRQTYLDKTVSSAQSVPRGFHVEQNEAGVAGPTGASKAEVVYVKNIRRP
jgi:hypothetical protein